MADPYIFAILYIIKQNTIDKKINSFPYSINFYTPHYTIIYLLNQILWTFKVKALMSAVIKIQVRCRDKEHAIN